MKNETKCLHSGYNPKNGEPRVMPIYQSTTFVYDTTKEVGDIFDMPTLGPIYSRFFNPTVDVVEKKIAELEGSDLINGSVVGVGFLVSALLMFVARPLSVFICSIRSNFSLRERLFITGRACAARSPSS